MYMWKKHSRSLSQVLHKIYWSIHYSLITATLFISSVFFLLCGSYNKLPYWFLKHEKKSNFVLSSCSDKLTMPALILGNVEAKAELHVQKSFVCKKLCSWSHASLGEMTRGKQRWHPVALNQLSLPKSTHIYLFIYFILPAHYRGFVLNSTAAGDMQTPTWSGNSVV